MEKLSVCNDLWLKRLDKLEYEADSCYEDCITSEGPAPMPFRIQAPMKLEYVVALALQTIEARQIRDDKIATGRRPIVCDMGTLRTY